MISAVVRVRILRSSLSHYNLNQGIWRPKFLSLKMFKKQVLAKKSNFTRFAQIFWLALKTLRIAQVSNCFWGMKQQEANWLQMAPLKTQKQTSTGLPVKLRTHDYNPYFVRWQKLNYFYCHCHDQCSGQSSNTNVVFVTLQLEPRNLKAQISQKDF